MTHYIAMSGMHGCLPDSCNAYETQADAEQAIIDLFDLNKVAIHTLKHEHYVEFNPARDGAEYASIDACQCSKPWEHCDAGNDPRDWPEYATVSQR